MAEISSRKTSGRHLLALVRLAAAVALIVLYAPSGLAFEDTRMHAVCKYCNMDREVFGHSRMLVEYSDGTAAGTCSLHCIAVELTANMAKVPCRILVGDYNSKKLIDAVKAHWVVGGEKPGVMTARAKWAFEKQAEAGEFVKKHGGKRASFQEALRAAYDDLYEDVKVTIERAEERKARGWSLCDQGKP
jgi:hypothetical protein